MPVRTGYRYMERGPSSARARAWALLVPYCEFAGSAVTADDVRVRTPTIGVGSIATVF